MSDFDRHNPEIGQGHGSLAPDRVDPADHAERLRDAMPSEEFGDSPLDRGVRRYVEALGGFDETLGETRPPERGAR